MAEKKLIFIIDDDPDILDSITAILKGEGFESAVAMSGEEGIMMLRDLMNPYYTQCM